MDIERLLSGWNLRTDTEANLQLDIASVLTTEDISFEREVALTTADKIDFLIGRIGVECKIRGACSEVLRQLSRYAQSERVDSIWVVTRKAMHRRINGVVLNGKVINVFWINDM